MRFGVLGPLAVWTSDGTEVAVPGAKVRALLAHLLVHPGRPVSADRLIDGLWGERLPEHPANALQGKVSQLRRVLERAEPGGRSLVGSGPAGYALRVTADAVDTGRFALLLGRARALDRTRTLDGTRAARGPRDTEAAVARGRLLGEALALWRGDAFADFAGDAFARGAIDRLEEERLTAREEQAEARLESGEHGPLAADLADLVARHPLRERLRAAQLRALYRSGRQTEALAAYEDLRRRLADDLGLVPGPELLALHGAILRQDPELTPPPAPQVPARPVPGAHALGDRVPGDHTPGAQTPEPRTPGAQTPDARTPEARIPGAPAPEARTLEARTPESRTSEPRTPTAAPRTTNLPAPVAPLLGRDDAVPGVRGLLGATRLVTLTGPGGVGKTRLAAAAAREVADAFPDGVWLVELATLDAASGQGPDTVAEAVARVLGLHEEPGAPVAAVGLLTQALRGRRLLLVLDNCEHVVDAVAAAVDVLLGGVPGLTVLATSQEPLDVSGERVWAVPPLELASAMELFRQRAGLGSGAALGADDAEAVAELCVRLDGLPLALELAAARVRTLGVHGLLARLDDRFALLARGFRGAPARQRTLRAVIDWSWSLLTAPERALLRRLAVPDGWTLDAARAVGAGGDVRDTEVLDLLSRLVDRSLVVASDRPEGPRYRVLESVREYGAEQLRAAGEFADVRERHSVHYAELAARAGRSLHGPGQRAWLDRLDEESANLRRALHTALTHGATGRALTMVNALSWYWVLRGRTAEARRSLDAALHAPADATSSRETATARALALAWRTGIALREGSETTDAGVDAYADPCVGTGAGVGPGGDDAGVGGGSADDGGGAGRGSASNGDALGSGPADHGNAASSNPADHGNAASSNPADHGNAASSNPADHGNAASSNPADHGNAAGSSPPGDGHGVGHVGGSGGSDGTLLGGEVGHGGDEAARLMRAALAAHRELDDPAARATALWILGSAQMGAGAVRAGERLVDAALGGFEVLGDAWGTAAALSVRARHALAHGDLDAARRDSERSARIFAELGDEWGQLQTVFPLATLSEIAGDYADAERLHRAGLAIAERLGLWTEASKRLSGLGRIALLTGGFEEARSAHGRALRLARDHGFRSGELDALIGLGLGARREGDLAGAENHMRALLTRFRRADYGPGITLTLAELGFVAEARGDAATARALHAEGFDVAAGLGDARAQALALEGLAGAEAAAGEHRAAAALLGAAAAARASVGAPLPAGERHDVDRVSASARARLGDRTYTIAFEEGGRLRPEAARHLAPRPSPAPAAAP
ncbi:AfsR/SARP family transcriptional regulator [Streptomyces typhae]|uniref:AfsR/SARP family transcriptional regulator n=1 Tax=Streptomyces typhae TaxID=2681492 RepID=UPI001FE6933C|nr:BTAD domain-containing putative transcriptional regulator [Streptomyces typhae]